MTVPARITRATPAGPDHRVVTVKGGRRVQRPTACLGCPWRRENVGLFPAEAFRISAHTAYDVAMEMFGCHESGPTKPATCVGFLLRGAEHNLAVRLAKMRGSIDPACLREDGADFFDDYREMAVANGVDPSDSVLERCR